MTELTVTMMLLLGAVFVNQYLEYRNFNNTIGNGEDYGNYYLNLNADDLSWADILYGSGLFIPSVFMVFRVRNNYETSPICDPDNT